MAIVNRAETQNLAHVVIISRADDAVAPDSDWEGYQETLDEAKLRFLDNQQPTRIVCNFKMSYKDSAKVKNHLMSARDPDGLPSMAFGDWTSEVARRVIKDIQEPAYLAPQERINWRTDKDGLAHPDVMAILDRAGVLEEIFAQYVRLVMNPTRTNAKN